MLFRSLRMVLGLVWPTAGSISLFGDDHSQSDQRRAALRRVGAVVEQPAFYPYLTGRQNLRGVAIFAGLVSSPETHKRVDDALGYVGLATRGDDAYRKYSLGMKQRLGIASTLLRDPELIILDEPTNGLDPAGTREVRELIPRLAQQGHTVFLCSHLLHEVQAVSDRVAIVKRGRMIVQGTVEELLGRGQFMRLRSADLPALEQALHAIPWVTAANQVDGCIRAAMPVARAAELNGALASQGILLSELTSWETDLEDVFLELTGEEVEA